MMQKDKNRWIRLGVTPEDLLAHPQVTPIIIKSLGSIKEAIEVLRGSDAKEARSFIHIWDSDKEIDHKFLPFEAYCLAAKCTPKRMMGVLMEAVTEQSHIATELLVASAHPKIIERTIKNAKAKDGVDDRKMIHQNRGFLPIPKTQQFNNYGQITQDNRNQLANVAIGRLEEDNDKISLAVDKFNANRVLNAGNMEAEVIEAVEVVEDVE